MKKIKFVHYSFLVLLLSIPLASFTVFVFGASFGSVLDSLKVGESKEKVKYDIKLKDEGYITTTCQVDYDVPENPLSCQIEKRYVGEEFGDRLLNLFIIESEIDESTDKYELIYKMNILPKVRAKDDPGNKGKQEREIKPKDVKYLKVERESLVLITKELFGLTSSIKVNVDQNTLKGLILSEVRKASSILSIKLERSELDQIGEIVSEAIVSHFPAFSLRKPENVKVLMFSGKIEFLILTVFCYSLLLTLITLIGHYNEDDTEEWNEKQIRIVGVKAAQAGQVLTFLGLLGTLIGVFITVTSLGNADFVDELRKVFDQSSSFGAMGLSISTSVVGVGGSIIVWLIQMQVTLLLSRDYFSEEK